MCGSEVNSPASGYFEQGSHVDLSTSSFPLLPQFPLHEMGNEGLCLLGVAVRNKSDIRHTERAWDMCCQGA